MNENSKPTEMENVIFYVSYGILTDKRNSYVFLKRSTEIRLRMNGNVKLETRGNSQTVMTPLMVVNQFYVYEGQCYYPSMRTENKGLLALFSVRQERRIDYNFKWAITGTGSLSAISI